MSKIIRFWNVSCHAFFIAALCLFLASCTAVTQTPSSDQLISDLEEFLSKQKGLDISMSGYSKYAYDNLDFEQFCFQVFYELGDISYNQIYLMTYDYSKAFGWSLTDASGVDTDKWTADSVSLADTDRILADLEGQSYFSGYSNGQIESKRTLSVEITDRTTDASVGYDRIEVEITLNADDVHEIVTGNLEYLLDESSCWYLFAHELTLSGVKVLSGVDDDVLKDGLDSITIYRDDEDSTWSFNTLNRLTYEVQSSTLDSENSQETVIVAFRGEDDFMYITGTLSLDFRFSSGWYLYNYYLDDSACETGMLYESWELDEGRLLRTIVEEQPFSYDSMSDAALTEDMISEFEISEIKISENGRYQTAYFSYKVTVNKTEFSINGYGKYELLSDGTLNLDTWNDSVDDISFDLSGVWYACDVSDDYLIYYTMNITDNQNGVLTGQMVAYGADLTEDTPRFFDVSCSILGNITYGVSYEIFVENWTSDETYEGLLMPSGQYDIANDELSDENIHSKQCVFTKTQPSDRLSRLEIKKYISSDKIEEELKKILAGNGYAYFE